ncbi:hypothetical protein [Paraburkholderia sp. WC7.3d]|uniref:hypothetical protein n=1 Tax=Paraburkholderia sp. WC7.3d TaxID=2991069 RepID=UPI003D23F5FB
MTFTYCQTAKQRIAQQGAASIAAFLDEVPLAVRQKIVKALPTIPGFRKNSAPEFKKKCFFRISSGWLPGQVRASARRSEHLTRVAQVSWHRAGCGRMLQPALQDNANNDEPNPTL